MNPSWTSSFHLFTYELIYSSVRCVLYNCNILGNMTIADEHLLSFCSRQASTQTAKTDTEPAAANAMRLVSGWALGSLSTGIYSQTGFRLQRNGMAWMLVPKQRAITVSWEEAILIAQYLPVIEFRRLKRKKQTCPHHLIDNLDLRCWGAKE